MNGNFITNSKILTNLSSNTVSYQIDKTLFLGCFIDYVVSNPSTNAFRSGTIMSVWDNINNRIEYTETSTNDLFDSTDGITFLLQINNNNIELLSVITSGIWNLKLGVRVL